jgi:hypothetical protein
MSDTVPVIHIWAMEVGGARQLLLVCEDSAVPVSLELLALLLPAARALWGHDAVAEMVTQQWHTTPPVLIPTSFPPPNPNRN